MRGLFDAETRRRGGKRGGRFGLAVALLAAVAWATQTRTWRQGDFADYDKAVLKNLSLRSDGLLTLAPRSQELFDTSSAYLWALASDSKGNLYAGGGATAKLWMIPPNGKGKLVADLDSLEIHALAVDARDRVYAATSPDGKIYRITGNSKPEIFYDPKAKYIWALAFDRNGDLLVATGDQGEIHRVGADGKGKVFFKSDETHVRSLAIDANGNLIAGTDPRGLVLRVSPAGEGFVLYQMPKREVTAVAVAPNGSIYAAAVGTKQVSASAPSASSAPPPPAAATVTASAGAPGPAPAQGAARPAPTPPPPTQSTAPGVSGGSEVYRIDANGNPRRVWAHGQDVVYAIAFDREGRALLGTGNKGGVYRVESPTLYTSLLTLPATQITAFHSGRDGRLYTATGNVGKVYEIGPGMEREGSVESDVFDAGSYTLWGRLSVIARLNGGQMPIATRSGNLDQPQKNWSAWSAANGRIASPAARFVQWKAELSGDGTRTPELESVEVAYLPKNAEPHVDAIDITEANYRFPSPSSGGLSSTQTLNLPPMGRRNSPTPPAFGVEVVTTTPTMMFSKGYLGARWVANDPNGDPMVYSVEIRGANETEWKLLKDKIAEKYFSWDSTAFADGEYRLRVTASDAPGNPPGEALMGRTESSPFLIDNTPPRITGLTAVRNAGKLQIRWNAADALSVIKSAEYSLDGGEWAVATPVTRLSDSLSLDYDFAIDAGAGEHTVAVRVQDEAANQSTEKVVVR